jgi:hypothetical protein
LSVEDLRRVALKMPRTMAGIRDRALLVSFSLGVRRPELLAVDYGDLTFLTRGARQGGLLFRGRHALTCPISALQRWLAVRGTKRGRRLLVSDCRGGL